MEEKSKLIRTFIAFDIDATLLSAIKDILQFLKQQPHAEQVKWSSLENLHVTIHFLGDVAEENISILTEKIKNEIQALKKFKLRTGKIITFPPGSKHPHILALTLPLSREIAQLHIAVERAIRNCNLTIEGRPYLPHLTLGRVRQTAYEFEFEKIPIQIPEKFIVKKISLFKSEQNEQGSIYTALATFNLV